MCVVLSGLNNVPHTSAAVRSCLSVCETWCTFQCVDPVYDAAANLSHCDNKSKAVDHLPTECCVYFTG